MPANTGGKAGARYRVACFAGFALLPQVNRAGFSNLRKTAASTPATPSQRRPCGRHAREHRSRCHPPRRLLAGLPLLQVNRAGFSNFEKDSCSCKYGGNPSQRRHPVGAGMPRTPGAVVPDTASPASRACPPYRVNHAGFSNFEKDSCSAFEGRPAQAYAGAEVRIRWSKAASEAPHPPQSRSACTARWSRPRSEHPHAGFSNFEKTLLRLRRQASPARLTPVPRSGSGWSRPPAKQPLTHRNHDLLVRHGGHVPAANTLECWSLALGIDNDLAAR